MGSLPGSVPDKPTAQDVVMRELAAAGDRVQRLEGDLDEARRRRDELIVKAARLGVSRRAAARAAGVTFGRVQQILDAEQARGDS
jgi:hypothetical protein